MDLTDDGIDYEIDEEVKQQTIFKDLRAFTYKWPYIACTGFGNYLLIINANIRKRFKRIQIGEPDEKIQICFNYITETNDLFFVTKSPICSCESKIDDENPPICCTTYRFKLFKIDLEHHVKCSDLVFTNEPIYEYTNVKDIVAFHVRGSHSKLNDENKILIAFFQHGDHIFSWKQLNERQTKDMRTLKFLTHSNSSKFIWLDDSCFYFLHFTERDDKEIQAIKRIRIS